MKVYTHTNETKWKSINPKITIIFILDLDIRNNQTIDKIWVSYKSLHESVNVGSKVLLDDGAVELVVQEKLSNKDLLCKILNTGRLGNKKGM